MFDREQNVEVRLEEVSKAIAALTAVQTPPVRIVDGETIHHLRPNNVLRITSNVKGLWNVTPTAAIITTDGEQILFTTLTADAIAKALGWNQSPSPESHGVPMPKIIASGPDPEYSPEVHGQR